MLGISATLSMSAEEAQAFYRQHRNQRKPKPMVIQGVKYFRDHPDLREALSSSREIVLLKRLVRSVTPRETQRKIKDYLKRDLGQTSTKVPMLPVKEIDPLSPFAVEFFASKTTMRIDKAQAVLGYRPRYTLEDGMRLTEMWARWSKII
jgi:nucleoside-diphosphate-sugar epimerase